MSVEAEKAVIGIILMEPEEFAAEALKHLSKEMFSVNRLGAIFEVIKNLHTNGKPIDVLTVAVNDDYKTLVAECASTVPSISGFQYYVNIVMDDFRKRDIENKVTAALAKGYTADEWTQLLKKMLEKQNKILSHQRDTTKKNFEQSVMDFFAWYQQPNDSISTGLQELDEVTCGLQRKSLNVIAARPGKGKSTLGLQIAFEASKTIEVLYQSMEEPREKIVSYIFSRCLTIDSKEITKRNLENAQLDDIGVFFQKWKNACKLTIDDSPKATISDVEQSIIEYKPQLVVIDHLGLITPEESKQKKNEELAQLTRSLKTTAMKHGIAIIALVQANRAADKKRIEMSDMFGSATIEHDADMIIALNADPDDDGSEILEVVKNRHGGTGEFSMAFQKRYHRFVHKIETEYV